MTHNTDTFYKVVYLHQSQVQEIMVKQIYTSDLYGFIEIEEFALDYDKSPIVDPAKEKLQQEFSQVRRSYIPIQHILRIDEMVLPADKSEKNAAAEAGKKNKKMLSRQTSRTILLVSVVFFSHFLSHFINYFFF